MAVLLARNTRATAVEESWYGDWVIAKGPGLGALYASRETFLDEYICLRSVAKLFQTYAGLGLIDRKLKPEQIAVCTASHSGESEHTDLVDSFLDQHGLNWRDLSCGEHRPFGQDTAWAASGTKTRKLQNNCSGKHALMLLVCHCQGWSLNGYSSPDHPLQKFILSTIAKLAGLPVEKIELGIDGCGVPTFGIPVRNALKALNAFRMDGCDPTAAEIAQSMVDHPSLVSGRGRLDFKLSTNYHPGLLVKSGAGGLVSMVAGGKGMVLLKLSTSMAQAEVLCQELLGCLGLNPLQKFPYEIKNLHGEVVSKLECLIRI